jgi:hypothetical protein
MIDDAFGFTGTRNGMTDEQHEWIRQSIIYRLPRAVHHGACVGSDEQLHHMVLALQTYVPIRIVVHPPINEKFMMSKEDFDHPLVVVLPAKDYHPRNHDIVDATPRLVATPEGPEELLPRSGTWSTIRYAAGRKPVLICNPNGSVDER